jgi:hypothetical protein
MEIYTKHPIGFTVSRIGAESMGSPEYKLIVSPVGLTVLLLAHKKSPCQHD